MPTLFGDPIVSEVQPHAAVLPGPQAAKLPHPPNAQFVFKWHPLRWQFFPHLPEDPQSPEEGEWLPVLGTMQLDLGVGGIDKTGDDSMARAQLARRGWFLLERGTVPAGTRGGDYVTAWPCNGGWHYTTAWETPQHVAGRVVKSKIDEAGYRRYLRWLVAEGHIRPMSDGAREIAVDVQSAKLSNIKGALRTHPDRKPEADEQQAKVAAMEAAPLPGRPASADPDETAALRARLAALEAELAAAKAPAPVPVEPAPAEPQADKPARKPRP